MTTVPNDWKSIGEELEVIKKAAFHEGYEKAIEDFGKAQEKVKADQAKVDKQIQSWHLILENVRKAWSAHTGEPTRWIDPEISKSRYQLMFGHKTEYGGGRQVNMPEDMDEFILALSQTVMMAADFKYLLAEFEKNELVKAQWDRLLVAMRMTGG